MSKAHSLAIRFPWTLRIALFAGCVVATLSTSACTKGQDQPPHIVLITADALRPDHLGFNGYGRPTSSAIDAFASEALLFDQAVTVIPATGPSYTTIFTGWHPETHGVQSNLQPIPAEVPVLAELLRDRGYATAAIVCNPVLQRSLGFARGIDEFALRVTDGGVEAVEKVFKPWAQHEWNQPTFIWLHFLQPHGPYDPPASYVERFAYDDLQTEETHRVATADSVDQSTRLGVIPAHQQLGDEDRTAAYIRYYDANIAYLDDAFGRVITILKERGVYEQSAIAFLSSYGESLGEHNYYFEHGEQAYDTCLKVPLLIKLPNSSEGQRIPDLVSLLDVFPTILGLAGVENIPPGPGQNLLSPLASNRALVVTNSGGSNARQLGLRMSGIKFLVDPETGRQELYDLAADPSESNDLSQTRAEALAQVYARYEKLLAELQDPATAIRPGEAPEIEHIEKLRALGYVQ